MEALTFERSSSQSETEALLKMERYFASLFLQGLLGPDAVGDVLAMEMTPITAPSFPLKGVLYQSQIMERPSLVMFSFRLWAVWSPQSRRFQTSSICGRTSRGTMSW